MNQLITEFSKITDKHRAERDASHERQCQDYRDQISQLKDMNLWYHNFIQELHKESQEKINKLKIDPMQFFGPTVNPVIGIHDWGGIMTCAEAAIKTNVGS